MADHRRHGRGKKKAQKNAVVAEAIKHALTEEKREELVTAVRTEALQMLSWYKPYMAGSKKGTYVAMRDGDLKKSIFWRAEGSKWIRQEKKNFVRSTYLQTGKRFIGVFEMLEKSYRTRATLKIAANVDEDIAEDPDFHRETERYLNIELSGNLLDGILEDLQIADALSKNEYCKTFRQLQIHRLVLDNIPEDITLLFPAAREKQRHFILHVGDTNSGKTYEAIQDMKKAESGVYLAPLRLLALETQERLLDAGVPCSMITGEEEAILPDARHMSSTIEILDTEKEYEVAVIDEAQMLSDEDRGWAWTKAILGVNAGRIHICMSANALEIVVKMIESCGDSYEVKKHHRDTPLQFEKKTFDFPEDVRPHDALIVFSRKNVIYVAGELERKHYKVSIIYGALPYDVRKSELARFLRGETDIIVSTDAIGMGMNLPVERIVFLESEKFDGKKRRTLNGPEVKQIAGRAGRKGLYEKGYVNALVDQENLRELLLEPYVSIKKARIQMPERLLDLNMSMSDTLVSWIRQLDSGIYEKANAELILEKCRYMELLNSRRLKKSLSKEEMWRFSLIPFDERNENIYDLWKHLMESYYMEEDPFEYYDMYLSDDDENLTSLEEDYRKLDLYFSFSRAVGYNKEHFRDRIAEHKMEISQKIIANLRDLSAEKKRCKYCNKELSWNYRFSICNRCRERQMERRQSTYRRMGAKR